MESVVSGQWPVNVAAIRHCLLGSTIFRKENLCSVCYKFLITINFAMRHIATKFLRIDLTFTNTYNKGNSTVVLNSLVGRLLKLKSFSMQNFILQTDINFAPLFSKLIQWIDNLLGSLFG